jgi:hypothetical protein
LGLDPFPSWDELPDGVEPIEWDQTAQTLDPAGGNRKEESIVLTSMEGQSSSLLLPQVQHRSRIQRKGCGEDARPHSTRPAEPVKIE